MKGGEAGMAALELDNGRGGEGEKPSDVFSDSRIASREAGVSQGGARMLALRCRLRRRASQRGSEVRRGG